MNKKDIVEKWDSWDNARSEWKGLKRELIRHVFATDTRDTIRTGVFRGPTRQ